MTDGEEFYWRVVALVRAFTRICRHEMALAQRKNDLVPILCRRWRCYRPVRKAGVSLLKCETVRPNVCLTVAHRRTDLERTWLKTHAVHGGPLDFPKELFAAEWSNGVVAPFLADLAKIVPASVFDVSTAQPTQTDKVEQLCETLAYTLEQEHERIKETALGLASLRLPNLIVLGCCQFELTKLYTADRIVELAAKLQ